MQNQTADQLTPIYSTENSRSYYANGQEGLRAALESRAKRAYCAYQQAETARCKILAIDLSPPLDQFHEPMRALEPYSHESPKEARTNPQVASVESA